MLLSTQGPFPPRTLPRFPGTTDPSATLTARPAPRGVPVDVCCISVRASRVAALFLFHACRRQYPDGNGSVPVSLASPSANGLPLLTGGSASVLPVSRPARRSLAFRPAWSLNRPRRPFSPECFSPCRYLHGPPWLLPTGATVVGRGSHPPEEGAFPRRTWSRGEARPALDRGSCCCRRLSPLAGASISFIAAFPHPRSSNRTCGFPASRLSVEIMPSPTESPGASMQGK